MKFVSFKSVSAINKQKLCPMRRSQGRALTIGSACKNNIIKCAHLLHCFIQRSPPNNRNQPMMAIHSGQLKAMPHASPFNKLRFISTNNDSFLRGIVAVSVLSYELIPIFIRHESIHFLLFFRIFMDWGLVT